MIKLNVSRTNLQIRGTWRNLCGKAVKHHSPAKVAVVLATGFIESYHWFCINNGESSLIEYLATGGYDVYAISSEVNWQLFKSSKNIPANASFHEILSFLLPNFQKSYLREYTRIHYVGHSFGTTLLLSFLMGYTKNTKGEYFCDSKLAKLNSKFVSSFTSISGLFDVRWPNTKSKKKLVYKAYNIGAKAIRDMSCYMRLSCLPFGYIKLLALVPAFTLKSPFSVLATKCGMLPSFNFNNANIHSLKEALVNGSGDESFELFQTILSLRVTKKRSEKSNALINFSADLKNFFLPIIFIQGECDEVTNHKIIRKYGFNKVGSIKKSFVCYKDTGHQDILVPKDINRLGRDLVGWFAVNT